MTFPMVELYDFQVNKATQRRSCGTVHTVCNSQKIRFFNTRKVNLRITDEIFILAYRQAHKVVEFAQTPHHATEVSPR